MGVVAIPRLQAESSRSFEIEARRMTSHPAQSTWLAQPHELALDLRWARIVPREAAQSGPLALPPIAWQP